VDLFTDADYVFEDILLEILEGEIGKQGEVIVEEMLTKFDKLQYKLGFVQ